MRLMVGLVVPTTKEPVVVADPSTLKSAVMVEEAVARKPLNNPMVVEVDTPQSWVVQAKAPPPPVASVPQ